MTEEYGARLTGAQMKLLRAAGLPDCTMVRDCDGSLISAGSRSFYERFAPFSLAADHAAYTLLEAGWLDGRDFALWFGPEKAPHDAVQYLTASGRSYEPEWRAYWGWAHGGESDDIIAYTRKSEGLTNFEQPKAETVTIAKMTDAEAQEWADEKCFLSIYGALSVLGLIKPEPTREEQFWSTQPNGGAHVTDDVKAWVREALEFKQ
jgi:hypothetical protein